MAFCIVKVNNATANSFGSNVTIYDGAGYTAFGQGGEDQETEDACVNSQTWDLEGFFLDGTKLTIVGGFDFENGADDPYRAPTSSYDYHYHSGDIFIDVDGDASYGTANNNTGGGLTSVNDTFGYDYALVLDFSDKTYDIYSLNSASVLKVWFGENEGSNPWRYDSGGSLESQDNGFEYLTGLTDAYTGFKGLSHNSLTVDLGFLDPGTKFISHFTMECGNDNLMGKGTTPASSHDPVVPEPGTIILFGSGLVGFAAFARARKSRSSGS